MSVSAGHAKLKRAGKDLLASWHAAEALWRDENSRRFQEDYVGPFLAKLRMTQEAMGHLELVLNQIRQDCGE